MYQTLLIIPPYIIYLYKLKYLPFTLFEAVQEERGPRKSTRLKKMMPGYGRIHRGKLQKSAKHHHSKVHPEYRDFIMEPNHATLSTPGSIAKNLTWIGFLNPIHFICLFQIAS